LLERKPISCSCLFGGATRYASSSSLLTLINIGVSPLQTALTTSEQLLLVVLPQGAPASHEDEDGDDGSGHHAQTYQCRPHRHRDNAEEHEQARDSTNRNRDRLSETRRHKAPECWYSWEQIWVDMLGSHCYRLGAIPAVRALHISSSPFCLIPRHVRRICGFAVTAVLKKPNHK